MRALAGLVLGLAALSCAAQDLGTQREIQRALIQRDQQSAEFAAGVRGAAERASLEALHAQQLRDVRPLHPDPAIARQLRPYERQRMAEERELRLAPPVVRVAAPPESPLPLPGGPRHVVDPIPVQSAVQSARD